MQLSSETIGRLLASGRNYAGQIIAFAGGIGVMSAAQQKGLTDALTEIGTGVSQVIHGASSAWTILAVVLAPIAGPLLARWASKSATTASQAAAVKTAVEEANKNPAAAPLPVEVKATIVDATAALPEVVGEIKVTDKALETATASAQVKAVNPAA